MAIIQTLTWDKDADTYYQAETNAYPRPELALGPIQDKHAGEDNANANWLRERWVMFNGPGEPEIVSIQLRKSGSLDKTAMSGEDSDQAIVMDLDGVMRDFTLSGILGATAEEINTFVGKVNMLLDGAQIDEDALRFIQRGSNQVPARVRWNATAHAWVAGDDKGTLYPPDWAADPAFGLNVGVVLESFDWEYSNEACDEISFTLTFIEGVTY